MLKACAAAAETWSCWVGESLPGQHCTHLSAIPETPDREQHPQTRSTTALLWAEEAVVQATDEGGVWSLLRAGTGHLQPGSPTRSNQPPPSPSSVS